MNCPYCGEEMSLGYIQCRDGVYWTEDKRPVASVPFFGGERIDLASDEIGLFSGPSAYAYRCGACRKIIIKY